MKTFKYCYLKYLCLIGERRRECDDINHPGLNCNNLSGAAQLPLGLYLGTCEGHEMRQQVVAVGTPLPTASLPLGAQQGPVMVSYIF